MDTGTNFRRVEKRNRPPVSCEPCRTRKLKCNRGLPCDTCVRRDKSSICKYAANASRHGSKSISSSPQDIKDRLSSLENLVSSLLTGDAVIQPRPVIHTAPIIDHSKSSESPAEYNTWLTSHLSEVSGTSGAESALTPEAPHLQETGDGQVNYIDPSHWLSILDDIKEVRELLTVPCRSISKKDMDVDCVVSDASFLFKSNQISSLDKIVSSLPSRPICDMLLSWYFNSRFMILNIVHPAKFQDEYAAFWDSPLTAAPLWIALLFSVLSVTAVLRRISNITEPDRSIPPTRILQQRTTECLALGRYATANAHAVEAFILHLQSSFLSNNSHPVDLWFEMGTIIRLAFRMGYHRDPSNLAGISPFDGEMRRRVWLNVFQLDALMSYQLGFPSMIPTEFCDTEVPRNLEYCDLYVGMTALPPPRPLSEQTPALYIIIKAGVMAVFKKIVAHTQSLSVPSYDKTLALNTEMDQTYSAVPESLKRRDVNRSFIDNSCLIWQRCTIEVLYLKGLIVLHRRYISYQSLSHKFEPSRRTCVEAALDILSRQADLHSACEPGGRLYEDRWMMSTLPVHDFLLAAMVICLDLSVRMRSRNGAAAEGIDFSQLAGREYRALQTSQQIWAASSTASPEAHIAALALDLMIKKIAENDARLFVLHGDSDGDMDSLIHSELSYANSMSQMIDGSEDIDWGLLDQYLQNMDPSILDTDI